MVGLLDRPGIAKRDRSLAAFDSDRSGLLDGSGFKTSPNLFRAPRGESSLSVIQGAVDAARSPLANIAGQSPAPDRVTTLDPGGAGPSGSGSSGGSGATGSGAGATSSDEGVGIGDTGSLPSPDVPSKTATIGNVVGAIATGLSMTTGIGVIGALAALGLSKGKTLSPAQAISGALSGTTSARSGASPSQSAGPSGTGPTGPGPGAGPGSEASGPGPGAGPGSSGAPGDSGEGTGAGPGAGPGSEGAGGSGAAGGAGPGAGPGSEGAGGSGGAGDAGGDSKIICTELFRQGLMPLQERMWSYRGTMTLCYPETVRGYHFWAIRVVRAMRRGKWCRFWAFMVRHRACEMAWRMNLRNRPDYTGKAVILVFHPVSFAIGMALKMFDHVPDFDVLYTKQYPRV